MIRKERALTYPVRARALAALLVGSVALTGCFLWTTRDEGDQLRREMDDRTTRVASLEERSETDRQELRAAVGEAKNQVADLQKVLRDATDVVTRNSADVGQEVVTLREQIAALEGQIAELRAANEALGRQISQSQQESDERMAQVARKAGIDIPLNPNEIPADRAAHWTAIEQARQAQDWNRTRGLAREFVARYAADELADDAQHLVGASFLAENRPASALGEFRRVITAYPQGDAVDDALFDMGESFWRLHACTDAKGAFEALLRTQARSPFAARARTKLREIRSAPRSYCTS